MPFAAPKWGSFSWGRFTFYFFISFHGTRVCSNLLCIVDIRAEFFPKYLNFFLSFHVVNIPFFPVLYFSIIVIFRKIVFKII